MRYAVIFDDGKIAAPFRSVGEILDLDCFPVPDDLIEPDDWEAVDNRLLTKPVCSANPPTMLTGQIVRYVGD